MKRIQSHPGTLLFRHAQATQEIISRLAPLGPDARLLCFGSSWGAEVLPYALALPEAMIIAAEIDPEALAKCRALFDGYSNVEVVESNWKSLARSAPYHAINCNAVLCKYPAAAKMRNISDIFPFFEFEDIIGKLSEILGDDGVLSLYNANYSLLDSSLSDTYLPFYMKPSVFSLLDNFVSNFDRQGEKVVHVQMGNPSFSLHVSKDFDTTEKKIRKNIAKLINQGVFVKNPSSQTEKVLQQQAEIFDMQFTDIDAKARLNLNDLYEVKEIEDTHFKAVPIIRDVQIHSEKSSTGKLKFISLLWWDNQLMSLPIIDS